jgi:hypothetical protein
MKMHWKAMTTVCCVVCLAGLLTGCATIPKEQIAGGATDYNLIVEKSQNEMLLLNIIRASKRRPMYFTASTKLTGQMSYSYETGSINIPLGKFGTNPSAVYSIAPKVSYSTVPTIDVAVLNDKEFFKGMLKPISLETVQDYWLQGWHRELLLNLFVHRVKTEQGKILSGSLDRYYEKGQKKQFEDFQSYLRDKLSDCNLVTEKKKKKIGPPIDICHASDLEQLIALNKAELELNKLKEDEGKYQLEGTETTYYFECSPSAFSEEEFKNSGLTSKKLIETITADIVIGKTSSSEIERLNGLIEEPELYKALERKLDGIAPKDKKRIEEFKADYEESEKDKDKDKDKEIKKLNRFLLEVLYPQVTPKSNKRIKADDGSVQDDTKKTTEETPEKLTMPTIYVTLRSPEAILYYLGEIMRAEKDSKDDLMSYKPIIYLCDKKVPAPLFVAREATADDKNPFVTVDYEGTKYIIPRESDDGDEKKCSANNSIHVLSLVSLLIARQVKVSELPPPTGVSIGIGR